MSLSVLARLVRKGEFEKFNTGLEGTRTSAKQPAKSGFTRGSLGSMGSTKTVKKRNPDAQDQEDRAMLNSPIMDAFLNGGK